MTGHYPGTSQTEELDEVQKLIRNMFGFEMKKDGLDSRRSLDVFPLDLLGNFAHVALSLVL